MYKKLIKEYKFILSKMLIEAAPPPPDPTPTPQPNPIHVGLPLVNPYHGPLFGPNPIEQWLANTPADSELNALNLLSSQDVNNANQNELHVAWQAIINRYFDRNSAAELNLDAFDIYSVENPNAIYDGGTGQVAVLPPPYRWQQIPNSGNPPKYGIFNPDANPPGFMRIKDLFGYGRNISLRGGARNYPDGWPILPRRPGIGIPGQNTTYGTNLSPDQVRSLLNRWEYKFILGDPPKQFTINLADPSSWPTNDDVFNKYFTFSEWLKGIHEFFNKNFGSFTYVASATGVSINTPGQQPQFGGTRAPLGFAGFVWNPNTGVYTVVSHSSTPGNYIKWLENLLGLMGWDSLDAGQPRPQLPPGFWNDPKGNPTGATDPINYFNWWNDNVHPIFGISPNPPGTHNLGPYGIHEYRPPAELSTPGLFPTWIGSPRPPRPRIP